MMNILNGGEHADSSADFQEYIVTPLGVPAAIARCRTWPPHDALMIINSIALGRELTKTKKPLDWRRSRYSILTTERTSRISLPHSYEEVVDAEGDKTPAGRATGAGKHCSLTVLAKTSYPSLSDSRRQTRVKPPFGLSDAGAANRRRAAHGP